MRCLLPSPTLAKIVLSIAIIFVGLHVSEPIQNLAWARQPLLEEERAERSLSTIGDLLGDAPTNYTLLNLTGPFKETQALQAALLMAYVGYGSEYWYMGMYTAFAYKVLFFIFTVVSTFLLRLYPVPPGGDSFCTFLSSLTCSVLSFVCWTWQVYNLLDMYYGRFLDACGRIPEPIFSFVNIYYWELQENGTKTSL